MTVDDNQIVELVYEGEPEYQCIGLAEVDSMESEETDEPVYVCSAADEALYGS